MAGEKKVIGPAAERVWRDTQTAAAAGAPAAVRGNCDVDADLPPAVQPGVPPPRPTDWVIGGVVLGEAMVMAYLKLRARFRNVRT